MIYDRNGAPIHAYGVGQVNQYIRKMFAGDLFLRKLFVKGEISNLKYHNSGHIYFSLKDDEGTISAVMFSGSRKNGLSFRLEEGQQVIVYGSIEVYETSGKYELYAKQIVLDGAGLLYEKFLKLKKELGEMGMFAREYKKPIPLYAGRVGIVTSPTGAAIRDIESVSAKRNPYVQLILCPAKVQGEGSAESIVRGIRRLEKENVDVIIVGRGGGSIEDLWAFNEEIVARAIFECPIPIISAVGHETDTTISDYVADLRVPTPTAAAEAAVFQLSDLYNALNECSRHLNRGLETRIVCSKQKISEFENRLIRISPENRLRDQMLRTASMEDTLNRILKDQIREYRYRIDRSMEFLNRSAGESLRRRKQEYTLTLERFKGLNPVKKLEMGYSYVETRDRCSLRSVSQAEKGDPLQIHVTDGTILAVVDGTIRKNQKED